MKPTRLFLTLAIVLSSALLLSACGKKQQATPAPTPTPRLVELSPEIRPYISLIPRADGHELKLKFSALDPSIAKIEYELLYLAQDEGLEIEKGVSGTITADEIEKDLLLGTASCTNGCKYKYDAGVTGGTLELNIFTTDNQVANYKTPFTLKSTADLKTDKTLSLDSQDFSLQVTPSASEFFVLLKNFGTNGQVVTDIYSVFSSGSGKGKVISITPATATHYSTSNISGDYLIP